MSGITYFYTLYYPNQWGGVPEVWAFDPLEGWRPIPTLQRAKQLAETFKVDEDSPNRCVTTYGVMCSV